VGSAFIGDGEMKYEMIYLDSQGERATTIVTIEAATWYDGKPAVRNADDDWSAMQMLVLSAGGTFVTAAPTLR
jgi:hypothetical protein